MNPIRAKTTHIPKPSVITKPFWDAAKQEKLVIQYDPDSRCYQWWPRAVSVKTGKANLEWKEVSGNGTLYSYTVTHVPAAGFEDKGPYLVGLVELDEGVRIISNLSGVTEANVKIGMPLRVTWEKLTDDINLFSFEPRNMP
ncbi:MAG: Zn-ribbon domain-containing OB-fold protein [Betaproteobacteria bacterium]|nr:Zn-ribbon domain-containing OB-fold protein [Betaproteobacteria bacterium]